VKRFAWTILAPFSVQLLVLLAWYMLCRYEVFPPTLLIPPSLVWQTIIDLWNSGDLQTHMGWSLRRVGLGYSIGVTSGIAVGAALGSSRKLETWFGPTLDILKQVPVFAWAPMMIVFFGIEETSKLAFIAVACFYPVLLNTTQGVKNVQKKLLEVGEVFGLSRAQTFLRIVVPSALPPVLTGLRQSITLAWMAVVSAELMGAESGIGFFMTYSRQLFQMDGVIAGVLLVGAVGIVTNALFGGLQKWLVPWTGEVA
jgi:sulfonate transport system permease protein